MTHPARIAAVVLPAILLLAACQPGRPDASLEPAPPRQAGVDEAPAPGIPGGADRLARIKQHPECGRQPPPDGCVPAGQITVVGEE